jgi:hypothetical protein
MARKFITYLIQNKDSNDLHRVVTRRTCTMYEMRRSPVQFWMEANVSFFLLTQQTLGG